MNAYFCGTKGGEFARDEVKGYVKALPGEATAAPPPPSPPAPPARHSHAPAGQPATFTAHHANDPMCRARGTPPPPSGLQPPATS